MPTASSSSRRLTLSALRDVHIHRRLDARAFEKNSVAAFAATEQCIRPATDEGVPLAGRIVR